MDRTEKRTVISVFILVVVETHGPTTDTTIDDAPTSQTAPAENAGEEE